MHAPHRSTSRETTREVLVFILGGDEYGVDILKVQEIRGYEKVAPIPAAPDYVKGVINLRGAIVPVIDLRVKFRLGEVKYDQFTVVVILRLASRVIGVVVDGVSDVMALTASEVRAPPQLGAVVDASFISGVATQGERMVLLLDIEKLLSTGELNVLARATEAAGS
jgi:purine-binding chemotaxis protein CheW